MDWTFYYNLFKVKLTIYSVQYVYCNMPNLQGFGKLPY